MLIWGFFIKTQHADAILRRNKRLARLAEERRVRRGHKRTRLILSVRLVIAIAWEGFAPGGMSRATTGALCGETESFTTLPGGRTSSLLQSRIQSTRFSLQAEARIKNIVSKNPIVAIAAILSSL